MKSSSKAFTFIEVIFVSIILSIILSIIFAVLTSDLQEFIKKSNAQQSQPAKQTQSTNKGTTWN